MPAVMRSRPGSQRFRYPPMVAAGERYARVVGRVLSEVGAPRLLVQVVQVVGWLVLPASVGHKCSSWPKGVEQGAHDGFGAADHVAERAHPAMNHDSTARS